MNKRSVRSFSIGILFAALLIFISGFGKETDLSLKKAKEVLKDEGYVVVTKEDYAKLSAAQTKEVPEKTEEQKVETKAPEKEEVKVVHFALEITSGMSTGEISSKLKQANVLDNEKEFEQFLIENGYHTKVQVGTFELNSEMNHEEIAKIITKS
ncbi:endolytic transglycosylase MltG [Robertmurraya kyonggiensis]|uniref:Endolytic transglycosylase MltG n=1 Tax=Robertmurraya kyonggiensis TaxID=1037680 RepID=A0A4U1DBM7_9BACI|nr:endolytic transglycosylase MltG [Robertmurraya kyonggiensis]TKC19914.1 endolytic transglycosylase MltG [Robertmurraya kyonggiensis]